MNNVCKHPYTFTKTTLERTKAVTLQNWKEEFEQHLSEIHSDENKWEDREHCDRIKKVPEPWKDILSSVLPRRMTSYMTGNSYVDTSVPEYLDFRKRCTHKRYLPINTRSHSE